MTVQEAIGKIENMLIVAEHDCDGLNSDYDNRTVEALTLAHEALKKQVPMIQRKEDIVKVVRCKDCKFYHRGKTWHCDNVSYFENGINGMFYCAWGEKK